MLSWQRKRAEINSTKGSLSKAKEEEENNLRKDSTEKNRGRRKRKGKEEHIEVVRGGGEERRGADRWRNGKEMSGKERTEGSGVEKRKRGGVQAEASVAVNYLAWLIKLKILTEKW